MAVDVKRAVAAAPVSDVDQVEVFGQVLAWPSAAIPRRRSSGRPRRRQPASCLRQLRRALEFGGHAFVERGYGARTVPGAAIGFGVGVDGLRQRKMDAPALARRRRAVDRSRVSG